jgi:hypothetical protein
MLAFRSVVSVLGEVRCEEFLYELKAGPAGGRLRRPSSAGSTSPDSGAGLTAAADHRRFNPEVRSSKSQLKNGRPRKYSARANSFI